MTMTQVTARREYYHHYQSTIQLVACLVAILWQLLARVVQRALQPVQTVLGLEMNVEVLELAGTVCDQLDCNYALQDRVAARDDIAGYMTIIRVSSAIQRPVGCHIGLYRRYTTIQKAIYGLYSALEGPKQCVIQAFQRAALAGV